MTKRQTKFHRLTTAAQVQSTKWLQYCNANPGPHQSCLSRLAVRNVLRKRGNRLEPQPIGARRKLRPFRLRLAGQ